MSPSIESAKGIFINQESELRCGWRILLFVFVFTVVTALIGVALSTLEVLIPSLRLAGEPSEPQGYLSDRTLFYLISSRAADLLSVVVATVVCAHLFERRSFGSVGFKFHPGWSRDTLLGCLIGGAAIALAVGIASLGGAVSIEPETQLAAPIAERALLVGAGAAALLFLIAAAFEELLFRGFAFQALVHNVGPLMALTLTSAFFGIAHLGNSGATTFSTINTMLAGVWLGLAYLATRSLWLATALHFSWNFVMVFVFGLPVSGWEGLEPLALVDTRSGNPAWLSGGEYGPEGGLAATIALALATLLVWRTRLFSTSDEMQAAIAHGRPPGPDVLSVTTVAVGEDQLNQKG